MNKPLLLVSAAALFDERRRVLLAQRGEGRDMAGLWEFPGGKAEFGETPEVCLIREIHEELGVRLALEDLTPFSFASHEYPKFHLLMPLFVCRKWTGTIQPREGQKLSWVFLEHIGNFEMPPADKPLAMRLKAVAAGER